MTNREFVENLKRILYREDILAFRKAFNQLSDVNQFIIYDEDEEVQMNILHFLASNDDGSFTLRCIEMILSHDDMDINYGGMIDGNYRLTAAHMAVMNKHVNVLKLLIDKGCDLLLCESFGKNVKEYAEMETETCPEMHEAIKAAIDKWFDQNSNKLIRKSSLKAPAHKDLFLLNPRIRLNSETSLAESLTSLDTMKSANSFRPVNSGIVPEAKKSEFQSKNSPVANTSGIVSKMISSGVFCKSTVSHLSQSANSNKPTNTLHNISKVTSSYSASKTTNSNTTSKLITNSQTNEPVKSMCNAKKNNSMETQTTPNIAVRQFWSQKDDLDKKRNLQQNHSTNVMSPRSDVFFTPPVSNSEYSFRSAIPSPPPLPYEMTSSFSTPKRGSGLSFSKKQNTKSTSIKINNNETRSYSNSCHTNAESKFSLDSITLEDPQTDDALWMTSKDCFSNNQDNLVFETPQPFIENVTNKLKDINFSQDSSIKTGLVRQLRRKLFKE